MRINKEQLIRIAKEESHEENRLSRERRDNRNLHKASMRIAMKIKRALRIVGMKQSQLAEKMGMDPAELSRLLTGKANLELRTMVRFEKELGINIIDRNISENSDHEHITFAAGFYQVTNIMISQPGRDSKKTFVPRTFEYYRTPAIIDYQSMEDNEPSIVSEPFERYS